MSRRILVQLGLTAVIALTAAFVFAGPRGPNVGLLALGVFAVVVALAVFLPRKP